MRKALPDGEVEAITDFEVGQVIGHSWNRDSSRLALHRQVGQQQSLWQLRSGETEPTLIAEYKTGTLSRDHWAPDAPLVYFAYSTSTQDVMMMSGVR